MGKIRVAIADENEVFRKEMVSLVESEIDLEVVLETESAIQLLYEIKRIETDVILMEMCMSNVKSIETTRLIIESNLTSKMIIWTVLEEGGHLIEMNKLGVKSYLNKKSNQEIFKAIRIVNQGGIYLSYQASELLRRYFSVEQEILNYSVLLSAFEKALIKAICSGYSSTQIGQMFKKSSRTIEDYRNALYYKFQVENKEQLIVKVVRLGLS